MWTEHRLGNSANALIVRKSLDKRIGHEVPSTGSCSVRLENPERIDE